MAPNSQFQWNPLLRLLIYGPKQSISMFLIPDPTIRTTLFMATNGQFDCIPIPDPAIEATYLWPQTVNLIVFRSCY